MTEKRYKMINTNLKDKDGVYYNIQRNDGFNVCQVFGKHTAREMVDELNALHEEKEYLKTRFHEERELAMRLSRECDTLTIKKQELELEIIRLETIIRTGEND